MIRTATVVEVAGGRVKVRNHGVRTEKAASSRRFWGVTEQGYEAAIAHGTEVKMGDMVEIAVPPGPTVAWGAITLVFPLLLFPVGWTAAGRIFSASGEGVRFLFGIAALALAYPVIGLVSRLFQRSGRGPRPEIQRVLSREETARRDCEARSDNCGGCASCG